jgi:FKBP-type peptidyl-prolyl cis-trans isomerase 2
MENNTTTKIGDTVTVHYTGKFEDGNVFDSSLTEGREPLKTKLGEGQLISGFENGLIGMAVGEKKTITLSPEEAYGEINPEAILDVPKDRLPENLEVGQILQGNSPAGPFIVKVLEVNEETAKLDHNHPMAGKTLVFDLELVGVE